MVLSRRDAAALVKRRHHEWAEHQKRWRWLQDSLEGGERYRHADYAIDPTAIQPPGMAWYQYGYDPATSEAIAFNYKQIVDRNLVPHISEMSPEGQDIYSLRLHRTPVPTDLARAIRSHTGRIYGHEVRRKGTSELTNWWADIDGCGTTIDQWMRETVAPLFLALGQLDLIFDHPEPPEYAEIRTKADLLEYGLDACVVGVILPENLVWWRLDGQSCRYVEVVVFERCEGEGGPRYRHWTSERCDVYDPNGEYREKDSYDHDFGCVPIIRVFDKRKVRCRNVGQSRYEAIAELQKAIYNATSELILGDVEQSHAQLSGPEDFLQETTSIPIGPGNILPKKKSVQGGTTTYEGWAYVEPPKGAQAEVRLHIDDFRDQADREAALLKPAGQNTRGSVAQSGVSKSFDYAEQNDILSEVSKALERLEVKVSAMARVVLTDGLYDPEDTEDIKISYPQEFDLFTAEDLATVLKDLQEIADLAGALPETQTDLLQRLARVALPGLDDQRQEVINQEISTYVRGRSQVSAEGTQVGVDGGPADGSMAVDVGGAVEILDTTTS